jgi:hypothetical protein
MRVAESHAFLYASHGLTERTLRGAVFLLRPELVSAVQTPTPSPASVISRDRVHSPIVSTLLGDGAKVAGPPRLLMGTDGGAHGLEARRNCPLSQVKRPKDSSGAGYM